MTLTRYSRAARQQGDPGQRHRGAGGFDEAGAQIRGIAFFRPEPGHLFLVARLELVKLGLKFRFGRVVIPHALEALAPVCDLGAERNQFALVPWLLFEYDPALADLITEPAKVVVGFSDRVIPVFNAACHLVDDILLQFGRRQVEL